MALIHHRPQVPYWYYLLMILIITNISLPPKDSMSKHKVRIHSAVEFMMQGEGPYKSLSETR